MSTNTPAVLILCAGESKRWTTSVGTSKHMIDIFGDPLLVRMCKQVNKYGHIPHVITHDRELINLLSDSHDVQFSSFDPPHREYTCQTFRSTIPLWVHDRVTVLLGDVLYSHALIDEIMTTRAKIMFYGSVIDRELYALTFESIRYGQSLKQILRALDEVDKRVQVLKLHGQLWQLFYSLSLNSLSGRSHPQYIPHRVFYPVTDFTQDFDKVEEYKMFLAEDVKDDSIQV